MILIWLKLLMMIMSIIEATSICTTFPSYPSSSVLEYSADLSASYPGLVQSTSGSSYQFADSSHHGTYSFIQAVQFCSEQSMRLCESSENVLDSQTFWTSTLCESNSNEYRIQINNGVEICQNPTTFSAGVISCCVDVPNAQPSCGTCPSGTFPMPTSIRVPNQRGLSLCSSAYKRPNVLFVISDDLRFVDESELANVMPNFSQFVTQGVFFMNAHSQMAMCTPSRTSFLTSLRPDYTKAYRIKDPTRRPGISVTSIGQAFKKEGYETVAYGKIFDGRSTGGRDDQDYPQSWSFPAKSFKGEAWSSANNTNCGYNDAMYDPKHNPRPFSQCIASSTSDDPAQFGQLKYLPDEKILDLALAKLSEYASNPRPFLLAVGFLRPHLPFIVPQRHFQRFKRSQFVWEKSIDGTRGPIYNRVAYRDDEVRTYSEFIGVSKQDLIPPIPIHQRFLHSYYAGCSYVDEMFTKLLDGLRNMPSIADDTIVVFLGDHGYHLGDHEFYTKKTVYEHGTKVPLLFLGPKRLFPNIGLKSSSPVELLDIAPTLYELAFIPIPRVMHGLSLVSIFRQSNPIAQTKSLAMSQFTAFGDLHTQAMSYSFRGLRYRYVVHWDFVINQILYEELYDYQTDPNEMSDVKKANASLMSAFRALFHKYMSPGGLELYRHEITTNFANGF